MIECKNCGAEYDEHEPKCPYCDTLNFEGAEEKYLDELDDLKENVEVLKDYSMNEYKATLKKESKTVAKIVIPILVVLGALAVLFIGVTVYTEYHFTKQSREQTAWLREESPELNEMYEAGDYDGLVKYLEDLKGDSYYFWGWKHSDFVWFYQSYQIVMSTDDTDDRMDAAYELFYGMAIQELDKKDLELVEGYQEDARKYLKQEYGITEEDIKKYDEEEK